MILTDLIIKIKGLSTPAKRLLLYTGNRAEEKYIYIKDLKETTTLNDLKIDEALKEIARVNVVNEGDKLYISPLIKRIIKDKDTLQISFNSSLLMYLTERNTTIKTIIDMSNKDKKTCLLFAFLLEKDKEIRDKGYQGTFNTIRDHLQASGKYKGLKDFQKNLISCPIRLINECLNWEVKTYDYEYKRANKNDKEPTIIKISLFNKGDK